MRSRASSRKWISRRPKHARNTRSGKKRIAAGLPTTKRPASRKRFATFSATNRANAGPQRKDKLFTFFLQKTEPKLAEETAKLQKLNAERKKLQDGVPSTLVTEAVPPRTMRISRRAIGWTIPGPRWNRPYRSFSLRACTARGRQAAIVAARSGELAYRCIKSVDGPRVCESVLGHAVRRRPLEAARRSRRAGRTAGASGVARLSGGGISRRRLELEGPAQADRALQRLSAIVGHHEGRGRARSRSIACTRGKVASVYRPRPCAIGRWRQAGCCRRPSAVGASSLINRPAITRGSTFRSASTSPTPARPLAARFVYPLAANVPPPSRACGVQRAEPRSARASAFVRIRRCNRWCC